MADALRTLLRGVGQTLITLGVVVLLFCVYELQVTGLVTARAQETLGDDLRRSWAAPVAAPAAEVPELEIGTGVAVLHVPALQDYDPWVVVEGTSVADLKQGPGHIPGTALPGEVGNVVLSGHRTTYGAPFNRFGDLAPGDRVVLETREGWHVYAVRGTQIVSPRAVEVTFPVPGQAGAEPTERLLTLTTCHPEYSARERLIVTAVLERTTPRADGPPAELSEA